MTRCKGIDDLLAAGRTPHRLNGDVVSQHFAQIRARLFSESQSAAELSPTDEPTPVPGSCPHGERPPFPIDVFPEPIASFARRVADAMCCPVDFPGLGILVASGAAIGAARSLQVKAGWHEKPGLYAVVVSRPGTTKTPALRAVMAPIYEEQERLYENYQAALLQYESALQEHKAALRDREPGDAEPDLPVAPPPLRHLFAADTTVEELANLLHSNRKGILVFRDELTAWVRSLDMYKGRGTDRQFFLSAWSGEMVKVDRRAQHGKPIIIHHPFLAVLGGIQPDLLDELEADGGKEDGFLHRILFAYPADSGPAEWTDVEIGDEDELAWRVVLNRLLNLQPVRPEGSSERPKRLQFNAAGKQAFITWYNTLVTRMRQDDFPPELFGPWSKLRAHCARFALIIHLLRVACDEVGTEQDEGQVDAEDVHRATQLADYFQAHIRWIFGKLRQSVEDCQVEKLLVWMRKKNLQRVMPRDIYRANVCGIRTGSAAEKLLQATVDRGLGDAEGPDRKPLRGRRGPELHAFVRKGG